VAAYIDAHAYEVDANGYRLVVRNGYHYEREVLTAAGPALEQFLGSAAGLSAATITASPPSGRMTPRRSTNAR
jgi:hypothetical protein